jgi:DNA-binding response OmpR family regulator
MKRILIVEDDVDLGQTVAQSLDEAGYATEVAGDGEAALDALRRELPDLVLLDLMMANMNGWEFRERQLAEPLWARIPVVVLTAVSDLVSATIQASEVLKKPVSLDEVLATIRRHAGEGREVST